MRIHEFLTETFLPTSAFAGSDKNKLGPAGHLKGSMKRPAGQGDLVGENFGNYYNENIASKVFSQQPDLTSEDDVLNAAWEHVVRDMGRKKAGHLFNYDEDFPSDLVSSYFYLQKQKQGVAEGLEKFSPEDVKIAINFNSKDPVAGLGKIWEIVQDGKIRFYLSNGHRDALNKLLSKPISSKEDWNLLKKQIKNALIEQQGVSEDQSVAEKTDPDLCRSSKRLGSSDHSSCVSQGLRAHQSKGKGHTDGQGSYIKGKKIRGSKYGGPLPDQDGK